MKDSGAKWIGKIPTHWKSDKLKYHLQRKEPKNPGDMSVLSLYRELGVIPKDSRDDNHNVTSEDTSNYRYVRVGDFVVNKMKAWQGSYGISKFNGIVSPAYFVFNLLGVKPDFFHHAIRSKFYVPYFGQASDGIRVGQWDLSIPRMKEIPFVIPPTTEQEQIVRYLDSMTAKINKLIRAKKKQIALLQEQKQAIINQAVTKGLNPDAEMKDSGIDWLGQIPAHWDCLPVKFCSDILPGLAFDSQYFSSYGKYLLLRGINVGIGNINHEEVIFWNYDLDAMTQRFQLQENDIVLGLDRPWIKQGLRLAKISQNDLPALLVQRVCRIRPHKHCDNDFLINAVDVVLQKALQSQTTGISVPHISTNQVGNVKIPLPTYEEQLLIVNSIAEKTKTLKSYTDTLKQEILIILEYKNSLIASVVTGQVDVRNIQVEEFDPADLITETDDDPAEDETSEESEE